MTSSDVRLLMSSEVLKQLREDVAKDPSYLSTASAMEPVVEFCLNSMCELGLDKAMKGIYEGTDKDKGARLFLMCLGLLQGLQIGVVVGAANESGTIWSKDDSSLEDMAPVNDLKM